MEKTDDKAMVVMAVNRYCTDCMESGEFLSLKLVMMNLSSGVWMCPKDECTFPLSSPMLRSYMEEDLTTEKVLFLTGCTSKNSQNLVQQTSGNLIQEKVNLISSPQHVTSQPGSSVSSTSSCRKRKLSDSGSSRSLQTNSGIGMDLGNDGFSTGTPSLKSLSLESPTAPQKKKQLIPLWENEELLCWLNSLLSLLTLNETLKNYTENCTLTRLLNEYKLTEQTFTDTNNYSKVKPALNLIRKTAMSFLQPKMISTFTEDDSPLLSIQFLIKTNSQLCSDVEIEFSSSFHCTVCQFERTDGFKKVIMSLPEAPPDLNFVSNLYHKRKCYKCNAPDQKTSLFIERYPAMFFVHFDSGVECKKYWKWFDFTSPSGDRYMATQIVQYLRKRRHFVLWSYSFQEKLWIEADDFKEPVVQYKHERPKCRPREVHLMVLEKVSTLERARLTMSAANESVDNDLDSLPITPDSVASPYSGNSSVVAQYSGQSSRQTSLCSSDGVLPTTIANKQHHLKEALTNNYDNNTPKHRRIMHVPNYKPFQARSKSKGDIKSNTHSVVTAAAAAAGTLIKSKDAVENSSPLLNGFHEEMDVPQDTLAGEVDELLSGLYQPQEESSIDMQQDFFDNLSDIVGIANSNENLTVADNDFAVTSDNLTVADNDFSVTSDNLTVAEDEKRVDFTIAPLVPSIGTDDFPIEISDDKLDEILDG